MRANSDKKYLWRLALISVACTAMSAWFLYDGMVTYPNQRVRALAYEKLNDEERLDEWPELAEQHGWPVDEDPGEPKSEADIVVQRVIAGLTIIPGIIYGFLLLFARKRWIESTSDGIHTSWKQQLKFDEIVSLDKKQWRSKGIARINYQRDGRKRRLVLDDWKYNAEPTKAILCEVEARISPDQIINGTPEAVPEDDRQ